MATTEKNETIDLGYPICEGVTVKLIGEDGNAFSILARVRREMRRHGISKEIQEKYMEEATSGDYDNLLAVTMKYVDVE